MARGDRRGNCVAEKNTEPGGNRAYLDARPELITQAVEIVVHDSPAKTPAVIPADHGVLAVELSGKQRHALVPRGGSPQGRHTEGNEVGGLDQLGFYRLAAVGSVGRVKSLTRYGLMYPTTRPSRPLSAPLSMTTTFRRSSLGCSRRGRRGSRRLVKDDNLRNKSPRVADIGQPAILAKRGEVLLDVT